MTITEPFLSTGHPWNKTTVVRQNQHTSAFLPPLGLSATKQIHVKPKVDVLPRGAVYKGIPIRASDRYS